MTILRFVRTPAPRRARPTALSPMALAVLLALAFTVPAGAQSVGAPLDHDAYSEWMEIDDEALSADGRWLLYSLQPEDEGDGELVVRAVDSAEEHHVPRGVDAEFDAGGAWVVFRIEPERSAVRQAKLDGESGDALPDDTLGILELATGDVVRIPRPESFRLPEDGPGRLAYRLEASEDDDAPADEAEEAREPGPEEPGAEQGDRDEDEKDKPEGTTLVLRDLRTGAEHRYEDATGYLWARDGSRLAYTASREAASGGAEAEGRAATADRDGVFVIDAETGDVTPALTGAGIYERLAWDRAGDQLAFVTNRDAWDEEAPAFALYRWTAGGDDTGVVARAGSEGLPAGWAPSEHGGVEFSRSGDRLYFGTAPGPRPEPEDTVPEDERVELDVWHWEDPHLQPMQLERLEEERERSYLAVAHLDDGGQLVQLATETVPEARVGAGGDADIALGTSELPYRKQISWDWPSYRDAYLIDVSTGERRRILEKTAGRPSLSPGAGYVAWYDREERHWLARDVDSGAVVTLTEGIEAPLWDEEHDRPYPAGAYGAAGWTEDDEAFLVYDRHDVWVADPTGERAPRTLTDGVGRADSLRFRHVRLDDDPGRAPSAAPADLDRTPAIDPDEPLLLAAFDYDSKASGFYRARIDGGAPERLVMEDRQFGRPDRAEDAARLLYTRESFREFPDLWVADLDLGDARKLSDANPQQADYRWGSAEQVSWTSTDGTPLRGILYTPDGFDPERTYPMMVYFYERMSDRLHAYHSVQPGGSSINISFYVSRGYVVFVPDIVYKTGDPGESALQAVVPGVLEIVDRGFVDPDRIGVQGHSWGGYQIAHMVTRTDLFAAAEAGAPVSNMTSAYGGIRWGTGMSRMFQYERTQSRIGDSLWERPLHYIRNSPLFQADRIETPLLYMHNDADGAVPWYQGIELFVALRRLGKPVWMLNYNGADHGLREYHNRRDFAIRMQQFFDHYLKDAPAPVWLEDGIPALRKGETLGLEPARAGETATEGDDGTHE